MRHAARSRSSLARLLSTVVTRRRVLAAWCAFVAHSRIADDVSLRRAIFLSKYHTCAKVFGAMREHAHWLRATRHSATRATRAAFILWTDEVQRASIETRKHAAATRKCTAQQASLEAALAAIDAVVDARAQRVARNNDAKAEDSFYKEASVTSEATMQGNAHVAAVVRLRTIRIVEEQTLARVMASSRRASAHRTVFDVRWNEQTALAIAVARSAAFAWGKNTRDGRLAVHTAQRAVVDATSVESASQECSEFEAYYCRTDGTIHFKRAASLALQKCEHGGPRDARAAVDVDRDTMTEVQAMIVGAAHVAGQRVVDAVHSVALARSAAWDEACRTRASAIIGMLLVRVRGRFAFVEREREATDVAYDVDSGEARFLWKSTGRVTDVAPLLFRGRNVRTPPDWILRRHCGRVCAGSAKTNGTDEFYYANMRHPWLTRPVSDPPTGYKMCQNCGIDFAVRCCTAQACNGTLTCLRCYFIAHTSDRDSARFRGSVSTSDVFSNMRTALPSYGWSSSFTNVTSSPWIHDRASTRVGVTAIGA